MRSLEGLKQVLVEAHTDCEFAAAVRGLDLRVLLEIGEERLEVRLTDNPHIPENNEPDYDIVIDAPVATWASITAPLPPPGYQSFTAVQRLDPRFEVRGDAVNVARALHALERLFELMRREPKAAARITTRTDATAISGRYRDVVNAAGRKCRLYYESAGKGVPIVLLHTAGADSRQFHELLCDAELGREWAMYAFDMPMHGRSFPAEDWQAEAYRLTESEYADWCVSVIRQIIGKPAVVLGCSMGAAISMRLAARHREDLLGVVALEAPDKSPGRRNPLLCHPEVNQPSYGPAYVRGLMSPSSPLRKRRLACWYYNQGGLGIYAGDLDFYSEEYDGTRYAGEIDASRLPMFFLTGEYDYSASPAATQRLVDLIPGSHFATMKGLGHFPMTENPELFKEYLRPVLQRLQERIGTQQCEREDA